MTLIKIELTDVQLHNLMTFLDRVTIQGLKELNAMNEIINTLNKVESNLNGKE